MFINTRIYGYFTRGQTVSYERSTPETKDLSDKISERIYEYDDKYDNKAFEYGEIIDTDLSGTNGQSILTIEIINKGSKETVTSGTVLKERLEKANLSNDKILKIMSLANQRIINIYNGVHQVEIEKAGLFQKTKKIGDKYLISIDLKGNDTMLKVANISNEISALNEEGIPDFGNSIYTFKAQVSYDLATDNLSMISKLIDGKKPSIIIRAVDRILNFLASLFKSSQSYERLN